MPRINEGAGGALDIQEARQERRQQQVEQQQAEQQAAGQPVAPAKDLSAPIAPALGGFQPSPAPAASPPPAPAPPPETAEGVPPPVIAPGGVAPGQLPSLIRAGTRGAIPFRGVQFAQAGRGQRGPMEQRDPLDPTARGGAALGGPLSLAPELTRRGPVDDEMAIAQILSQLGGGR